MKHIVKIYPVVHLKLALFFTLVALDRCPKPYVKFILSIVTLLINTIIVQEDILQTIIATGFCLNNYKFPP